METETAPSIQLAQVNSRTSHQSPFSEAPPANQLSVVEAERIILRAAKTAAEIARMRDAKGPEQVVARRVTETPAENVIPGCSYQERLQRREAEARQEMRETIQKAIHARVLASGIPEIYRSAKLSDVGDLPERVRPAYQRVAAELHSLIDDPRIMALVGGRGTGKTRMACALAIEIIERATRQRFRGQPAIYVTAREFMQHVRSAFGPGTKYSERDVVARYSSPQLLIIDEIGVRSGTDFEGDTITQVVDTRVNRHLATLFIGNDTPQALMQNLGASIGSRMNAWGGGIVVCQWEDLRGRCGETRAA